MLVADQGGTSRLTFSVTRRTQRSLSHDTILAWKTLQDLTSAAAAVDHHATALGVATAFQAAAADIGALCTQLHMLYQANVVVAVAAAAAAVASDACCASWACCLLLQELPMGPCRARGAQGSVNVRAT